MQLILSEFMTADNHTNNIRIGIDSGLEQGQLQTIYTLWALLFVGTVFSEFIDLPK